MDYGWYEALLSPSTDAEAKASRWLACEPYLPAQVWCLADGKASVKGALQLVVRAEKGGGRGCFPALHRDTVWYWHTGHCRGLRVL